MRLRLQTENLDFTLQLPVFICHDVWRSCEYDLKYYHCSARRLSLKTPFGGGKSARNRVCKVYKTQKSRNREGYKRETHGRLH